MSAEDAIGIPLLIIAAYFLLFGSLRAIEWVIDSEPLFEPQWKREARVLARYIPVADEWGR